MLREGAERPKISFAEFVALVAAMFSLVALSIDAMLPALGEIATDMGVGGTNQAQLVVVVMLFGLGVGQLFYGPISDSYGRRRPIYFGFPNLVIFSFWRPSGLLLQSSFFPYHLVWV